jgi:hypothetical protein
MSYQSLKYSQSDNAIALLHELSDEVAYRIISSTFESAKTVTQISTENEIPLSSTYKKIKKLVKSRILRVEKITIDNAGKKVIFYKSKIRNLEFKMGVQGVTLELNCMVS